MRVDVKLEPWSDWTDTGSPTKVKNLTRAHTIFEILNVSQRNYLREPHKLTHDCQEVAVASFGLGKRSNTID